MSSIRERFDWYSVLRSTQRVISVVRPLHGEAPAEAALWEIRTQLAEIGPDPESETDSADQRTEREEALQRLDDQLASVTDTLRQIAIDTPMAEFRAALPEIHEGRPQEAAGLLDLCVRDPEQIETVASLTEYLATLLTTERTAAGPRLVSDPAEATPRVREACAAIAERLDDEDVDPHVRALRDVCAEIPRADSIGPLITRMQQYKARLGLVRFTPEVLRAVVKYNVAVACRLQADLESERNLEQCDTPMTLELLAWEEQDPGAEGIGSDPGSMANEREALGTVVVTIGHWLCRKRLDASPQAKLVEALNISHMSQTERRLFTEPEEDTHQDLLREAVALGLILAPGDSVAEAVAALGMDRGRLRTQVVAALEADLQQATSRCMADNRFDDAKLLSRVRTRYLSSQEDESETRPPMEAPSVEPPPLRPCAPRRQAQSPPETPARRRGDPADDAHSGTRRPAMLCAAVLVCLAVAGVGYIQSDGRTVRELTPEKAGALSHYLESARRDGHGEGPSFFGIVNEEWNGLTREEQREHTRELAEELSREGVRELMLFDARSQLRGHYADGRLLHPKRR